MKVQKNQFHSLWYNSEVPPLFISLITQYGTIEDDHLEMNFPRLYNDFYELTKVKLVPSDLHKIEVSTHAEMIANHEIPFSTVNDHDLLLHTLPTIFLGLDLSESLDLLSKIEDDNLRAWAHEVYSFMPFIFIESHLKEFTTNPDFMISKEEIKKTTDDLASQVERKMRHHKDIAKTLIPIFDEANEFLFDQIDLMEDLTTELTLSKAG